MGKDDTLTTRSVAGLLEESAGSGTVLTITIVQSPDNRDGSRIPLTAMDSELSIGRDDDVSLPVADQCMSRRHATLYLLADGVPYLRDEGSRNGTFVNGIQLSPIGQRLAEGDTVRLGATVLVLESHDRSTAIEDADAAGSPLLGHSARIAAIRTDIRLVAASDLTVLISGESGTGKELVATEIHRLSARPGPLVAVNCGSIPETLAESILFGHVKGAFTGAQTDREGLFTHAHEGTLFLDEIGELPMPLQPKLLRSIENRTITPVGSSISHEVNARILAATNVDLTQAVIEGRFRGDLLARLQEWPIHTPPLRTRREDITPLFKRFLIEEGMAQPRFATDALEALLIYPWPYNVRELRNLARQLARRMGAAPQAGMEISLRHLPPAIAQHFAQQRTAVTSNPMIATPIEEQVTPLPISRERLLESIEQSHGNVTKAAQRLGISRSTMYRRLREFGFNPDEGKSPRGIGE